MIYCSIVIVGSLGRWEILIQVCMQYLYLRQKQYKTTGEMLGAANVFVSEVYNNQPALSDHILTYVCLTINSAGTWFIQHSRCLHFISESVACRGPKYVYEAFRWQCLKWKYIQILFCTQMETASAPTLTILNLIYKLLLPCAIDELVSLLHFYFFYWIWGIFLLQCNCISSLLCILLLFYLIQSICLKFHLLLLC